MKRHVITYLCLLALGAAAQSHTFETQAGQKIKGQFLTKQGTNIVVLGSDKKQHTILVASLTPESKAEAEKASLTRTESGAQRGEWVLDPKWQEAEARILKLQKRADQLQRSFQKSSMARVEKMTVQQRTTGEDRNMEQLRRTIDACADDIRKNRAIQAEVETRFKAGSK